MLRNIIVFIILLTTVINSQGLNEYYKLIERKIEYDSDYLDIYSVEWAPSAEDTITFNQVFPKADGTSFRFNNSEGNLYYFFFLKNLPGSDSLTLIRVDHQLSPNATVAEEGFFAGLSNQDNEVRINVALSFRDLNEMYFSNRTAYDSLVMMTESFVQKTEPLSELNIPIEDIEINSRGFTSMDNSDYLRYQFTNSRHMYPKTGIEERQQNVSLRKRKSSIARFNSNFQIDASFYGVTFYHNVMNLEYSIMGVEVSVDDQMMNLQPWLSMTMSAGLRSLIYVSQDQKNSLNDIVLDLRVLGRFKLNSSSFVQDLPFLFIEKPKLNLASGVVADLHTSKIYGFPFLNLYFAYGPDNYDNPALSFGEIDSAFAYFSTKQWSATMSFYWNTSTSKTIRFRFDIGAGSYNIVKAVYEDEVPIQTENMFNRIHPVVVLGFQFVPQYKNRDNELFSAKTRWFDNVLKTDLWMKVFEIDGGHTFRLEASFLSSPMYRGLHEWESGSSSYVGLRYKYGY